MTGFDLGGVLPVGTVVLEASAGTGKTHTIAALATRYVAEGAVRADQLAVITFSRVASQELRQRVRLRLRSTADLLSSLLSGGHVPTAADPADQILGSGNGEVLQARLDRLNSALADFDQTSVMTIHDFCQHALHGLGILAAQDPQASLLEDLTPLRLQTTRDLYLARYANAPVPPFTLSEADDIAAAAVGTLDAALVPAAPGQSQSPRIEFAAALRTELASRKHRLGVFSFDDQLLRLHDSLVGESATLARQRLRSLHKVVLVDEFQDTDPVQWRILRRTFHGHCTLVLIGDPKQAIYTFRGADVTAYVQAVREADSQYGLTVNHRADAAVVRALDVLFSGLSLGKGIDVPPVTAAHQQRRLSSPPGSPWCAPVRIRAVQGDGQLRIGKARHIITADVVAQVASLLADGTHRIDDGHGPRMINAADIAVLVRTNARGRQIARALARAGVPVSFSGADSIFGSEAANSWRTLLRALDHPRRANVRAVVLTDFIGGTLTDLATASEQLQSDWSALIHRWSRILTRHGVAALFAAVQADGSFADRVLAGQLGERALTDHRHLAELLHREESRGTKGGALVEWLSEAMAARETSGERTRRLETDGHAVQIMTVHRAKGLQFPVVLLPEASDQHQGDDSGDGLVLHDGSGNRVVDVGGRAAPGRSERFQQAQSEAAADSLRTLYVAATRAQCQLTMWWARTSHNTAASALHRVLFRRLDLPSPDLSYPVDRPPGDGDAGGLGWLADSGIVVEGVRELPQGVVPTEPAAAPVLAAAAWQRTIDRDWRRTSYTGITAPAHAWLAAGPTDAALVDDEPQQEAATSAPPSGALSPMAGMPAGAGFGTIVHRVFEGLDWYAPGREDVPGLRGRLTMATQAALATVRPAGLQADDLADALLPSLLTPLGELADKRRLADIPVSDRLAELDFELPLAHRGAGATLSHIAALLERHLGTADPLADYPRRLADPELDSQALRGYLTGSIDALLRVGSAAAPRFLVVDYKTNRITDDPDLRLTHFTESAMAAEMMRNHYPLQALFYSVAVHRFLASRLASYRPGLHLGGVLYLFVRGMSGDVASPGDSATGVFSWRPPAPLIVELSALLDGGER